MSVLSIVHNRYNIFVSDNKDQQDLEKYFFLLPETPSMSISYHDSSMILLKRLNPSNLCEIFLMRKFDRTFRFLLFVKILP